MQYIPTMTDKIRKIRRWIVDGDYDVDIEVDGGIKATKETIGACAEAGANCFIAGSGLFAYEDMAQGVKKGGERAKRGRERERERERGRLDRRKEAQQELETGQ